MSQTETDAQKDKLVSWLEYRKGLLLLIIGVAAAVSSLAFGKEWSWGELIYDLGMAVVLAAFLDLLVLRAMASWKPEWLKVGEEIEAYIAVLKKAIEENRVTLLEMKIDSLTNSVSQIQSSLKQAQNKLDVVLGNVHPISRTLKEAIKDKDKT